MSRIWLRTGSLALGALVVALAAACTSADPVGTSTASVPPSPQGAAAPPPTSSSSVAPGTRDTARQSDLDQRLRDAAWANDLAAAEDLIAQGADVNAKDDTQQSAYLVATSEGFLDLLNLTLAHGADVASKDSFNGTGLIRAGERGHTGVVGRLIRAGVEVDHVNRLGWTALLEAVMLGDGGEAHQEIVRLLLAAGADPEKPDGEGVTPLQHAQQRGYDAIAAALGSGS
jgi:uncharacterized protein